MEIFKAIILGVIEGLTEFLPVSSTGHLIVAQDMLGFYDVGKMFTVVIQTGAITAVVWFYRLELWSLAKGIMSGDQGMRRFLGLWVIATIPAGVVGLLLDSRIESLATTLTVAVALILGGIVILAVENHLGVQKRVVKGDLTKLSNVQALKIGLYQVLALVPGVSRSAATIIGGVLSGLDRVTATKFSFYLGIPILLLAGLFKIATGDVASVQGGYLSVVVGIIASFITAFFVVGWLLRYVSKHDFRAFAYYRIVLGIILLVLISVGALA